MRHMFLFLFLLALMAGVWRLCSTSEPIPEDTQTVIQSTIDYLSKNSSADFVDFLEIPLQHREATQKTAAAANLRLDTENFDSAHCLDKVSKKAARKLSLCIAHIDSKTASIHYTIYSGKLGFGSYRICLFREAKGWRVDSMVVDGPVA